MKTSKKVLIVSISEIYHNPRLIKAADEFHNQGFEVVVQDIILGKISITQYNEFVKNKPWEVVSIDISRRSISSRINFYICSVFNLVIKLLWNKYRLDFYKKFYLCKGLLLDKNSFKPDIIYTNVIDSIEFCVHKKKKLNAKFIFDSQELFTGQYQSEESNLRDWVTKTEQENIKYADIVLTTTNIMGDKLKELYNYLPTPIRVRNLPNKTEFLHIKTHTNVLRLIWHGYAIYLDSRGIKLILSGLKKSKGPVQLTLQGNINDIEKEKILEYLGNDFTSLVIFKPQAKVGEIVKSITNYDVGVIGEQAENDNQLYTSSNKLFDYLHAGLPVVTTQMPGILETINQTNIGLTYSTPYEFAQCIDKLIYDKELYNTLQKNCVLFAQSNNWSLDFSNVIRILR